MGQDSSKGLSAQDVDRLRGSTHFSSQEISEWYKQFHEEYPSGAISRLQFISMYTRMFPGGDARQYAEHVFRAYDTDHNGSIDFTEFMATLSMVSKGSLDERLEWTFNLYDKDGNGAISRDEAVDVVVAIYKMKGEEKVREMAQDTVSELFMKLDKNKDSRLSKREFMQGVRRCSNLMDVLRANLDAEAEAAQ